MLEVLNAIHKRLMPENDVSKSTVVHSANGSSGLSAPSLNEMTRFGVYMSCAKDLLEPFTLFTVHRADFFEGGWNRLFAGGDSCVNNKDVIAGRTIKYTAESRKSISLEDSWVVMLTSSGFLATISSAVLLLLLRCFRYR